MIFQKSIRRLCGAMGLAVGCLASSAQAETIKLTSLEWPPYSGDALPGQGETVVKLREILAKAGHDLDVKFFPWNRAVNVGLKDAAYSGYFPEYPVDTCKLSGAFDKSEVGFAIRAGDPQMTWGSVDSLVEYTFAVVNGYANDSGPFDAGVESGAIKASKVSMDTAGLKLVAGGRVNAAVIDRKVMQYLIQTEVPQFGSVLIFNEQLLKTQTLHVCLQDTPQGQLIFDAIEAAK